MNKCVLIPSMDIGKLVFNWEYAQGTEQDHFDKFVDIYPLDSQKPIIKCHEATIVKLSNDDLTTNKTLIQDYDFSWDLFVEIGSNKSGQESLSGIWGLTVYDNGGETEEIQENRLTDSRKAELFDDLLSNVPSLMSDGSWYDIFQGIGMSDEEMRTAGLDLPELKLTDQAVMEMAEYVAGQVRDAVMEDGQTHITIPLADLTAQFGIDLKAAGWPRIWS